MSHRILQAMTKPIPDAKLHRLLLTEADVRRLTESLGYCITNRPSGNLFALLQLQRQLERSEAT